MVIYDFFGIFGVWDSKWQGMIEMGFFRSFQSLELLEKVLAFFCSGFQESLPQKKAVWRLQGLGRLYN